MWSNAKIMWAMSNDWLQKPKWNHVLIHLIYHSKNTFDLGPESKLSLSFSLQLWLELQMESGSLMQKRWDFCTHLWNTHRPANDQMNGHYCHNSCCSYIHQGTKWTKFRYQCVLVQCCLKVMNTQNVLFWKKQCWITKFVKQTFQIKDMHFHPLLLADLRQMSLEWHLIYRPLQMLPRYFHGIEVQPLTGPIQSVNLLSVKPFFGSFAGTFWVVVLFYHLFLSQLQFPDWWKGILVKNLLIDLWNQGSLGNMESSRSGSRK